MHSPILQEIATKLGSLDERTDLIMKSQSRIEHRLTSLETFKLKVTSMASAASALVAAVVTLLFRQHQ